MTSGPASSTGDPWQAGSADAPAPYLLCIEGERATIVQLPRSGGLVIGRGPDCGLRLGDELASRTHAQVYAVPDGLRVEDCGSRHGTLVNGRKLTGAKLVGTGDVIGIGSVTLVVHRPRMPAGRALREPQALLKRFDEELERARRFRRELSVVVLRSERPLARTHVTDVVSDQLRLIDVAAVFGTHELVVLVPEAGCDEVTERARALVGALSGVAAGVATSPADGVDADTLLSCSRLAATTARLGSVASASDAVRVISLGGRDVVIADPAMVGIYALLERLARTSLPILILGESGVGKELAAAAVHRYSPRRSGPFVAINCAGIPEQLAESELFGHERGAFTGALNAKPGLLEAAHHGTVFLDEIGELPLAVQAKLLRAVESGEIQRIGEVHPRAIDVRIVAATNRDLAAEVAAGRFRQDLRFRIAAAQVVVPPLRDRPRDLAALVRTKVAATCERLGRRMSLSIAATHALLRYRWPGNVRELHNTLEYAVAAAADNPSELDIWHLPPAFRRLAAIADPDPDPEPERSPTTTVDGRTFRPIDDELRELERARIVSALAATDGVQNRAAALIAMPLRTFVAKLKRYAIDPSEWR